MSADAARDAARAIHAALAKREVTVLPFVPARDDMQRGRLVVTDGDPAASAEAFARIVLEHIGEAKEVTFGVPRQGATGSAFATDGPVFVVAVSHYEIEKDASALILEAYYHVA